MGWVAEGAATAAKWRAGGCTLTAAWCWQGRGRCRRGERRSKCALKQGLLGECRQQNWLQVSTRAFQLYIFIMTKMPFVSRCHRSCKLARLPAVKSGAKVANNEHLPARYSPVRHLGDPMLPLSMTCCLFAGVQRRGHPLPDLHRRGCPGHRRRRPAVPDQHDAA